MSAPYGVSERHMAVLRDILVRHVGEARVWVYGSRATGRNVYFGSDLDLAIEGEMGSLSMAELDDELEESVLPFKVHVIKLDQIDVAFRSRITPDLVLIHEAAAPHSVSS